MKKIGILTFHRAINYGAILQAYALQKKVADFEFDAEIIDYGSVGAVHVGASKEEKNIIKKTINYMFRPASDYRRLLKRLNGLLVKRIEDFLFKKDLEKQSRSFDDFKTKYLNISKKAYHTNKDLESMELIYDGVITGSDQVWNQFITQSDLAYFLNFLSNNNKKVSYAASFGVSSISEDFKKRVAPELRSFRHLSVREISGAGIIKNISGRDAQVVVDPTLLMSAEEWLSIIPENNIDEPYIFFYSFFGDPEIVPFCKYLSKITGYKIIGLSLYQIGFQRIKEYIDKSVTYVNGSGPLEFLSYLTKASMVVTNSFHGAAFSINFQKDFFIVLPKYSIERIVTILDIYKLGSRLQKKGDRLPAENDIKIDYTMIDPIVVGERNKSLEYLRKSLSTL